MSKGYSKYASYEEIKSFNTQEIGAPVVDSLTVTNELTAGQLNLTAPLAIQEGGTGARTPSQALAYLGGMSGNYGDGEEVVGTYMNSTDIYRGRIYITVPASGNFVAPEGSFPSFTRLLKVQGAYCTSSGQWYSISNPNGLEFCVYSDGSASISNSLTQDIDVEIYAYYVKG